MSHTPDDVRHYSLPLPCPTEPASFSEASLHRQALLLTPPPPATSSLPVPPATPLPRGTNPRRAIPPGTRARASTDTLCARSLPRLAHHFCQYRRSGSAPMPNRSAALSLLPVLPEQCWGQVTRPPFPVWCSSSRHPRPLPIPLLKNRLLANQQTSWHRARSCH